MNEKDTVYWIEIKAGSLINEKYPQYQQLNITAGAVDNINKGLLGKQLDNLSQEDAAKFESYLSYKNKIRERCRELIKNFEEMSDLQKQQFDPTKNEHWDLDL
jgi:hypothetical protein